MNKSEEETYNMRYTILIVIGFVLLSAEKCDNSHTAVVNLKWTSTESYCGGAAPPDDMIKDMLTPKPFMGRRIYVLNADKVCVDSLYPQSDTSLRTALKIGAYTAHLVPQVLDLSTIESEDAKCDAAFIQRIVSMFEIDRDTNLTANIHFGCNPCLPPAP